MHLFGKVINDETYASDGQLLLLMEMVYRTKPIDSNTKDSRTDSVHFDPRPLL